MLAAVMRVKVHRPLADHFLPDGPLTSVWSSPLRCVSSVSAERILAAGTVAWRPPRLHLAEVPFPVFPGSCLACPQMLSLCTSRGLHSRGPQGWKAAGGGSAGTRPGPDDPPPQVTHPLAGCVLSLCCRVNPHIVFTYQNHRCWHSRPLDGDEPTGPELGGQRATPDLPISPLGPGLIPRGQWSPLINSPPLATPEFIHQGHVGVIQG